MKLKCLLLAIILICSFTLSGCYLFLDEELGGVLDSEIEERIKTDYARRNSLNADKLEIVKYFGRCGENYIVLIRNYEYEKEMMFDKTVIWFNEMLIPKGYSELILWSKNNISTMLSASLKGNISTNMIKHIKSELDKLYPYLSAKNNVKFECQAGPVSLKNGETDCQLTAKIDMKQEFNEFVTNYLMNSKDNEYSKYTDEFFIDHSLIIAVFRADNSNMERKVEECYISKNDFVIHFEERSISFTGNDDYFSYMLIVEVSKSEASEVQNIFVIVK